MNAIVPVSNAEVYRASTDAAGLCREIVLKTAQNIQGRKYVRVEGWQAIAVAHGCVASAEDVRRVNDEGAGGFSAMGVIRRMSDGAEIARAEGFVGDDESMWAKRPVYARRAMCQTRAISRACRSAFAHVVVLIDSNLSTTPAEEVPDGGFDNSGGEPRNITPKADKADAAPKGPALRKDASPAAVTACKAGMDACKTEDEIRDWWPANQTVLDELNDAEFKTLKDHYEVRWGILAGTFDPKAAKVGATAEQVFA